MILKIKAVKKPEIIKLGTIKAANIIIKVFITKVNNPNVNILIGKVKKIKIGLITALTIPKTTATKTAVKKLSI